MQSSPNTNKYHIQDVNRAMGLWGFLQNWIVVVYRRSCPTVLNKTIGEVIDEHDIMNHNGKFTDAAKEKYFAAPGGFRNIIAYSQDNLYKTLDMDRANGCIRTIENAYFKDGGLAVLFGNLAENGCIVKTAGVDESILVFAGKARVFDSQDAASEAILGNTINKGDIIIIRYEGPKGGPGMQEMLYPTTYLKSKNLDKDCALLTDGRFSGGTSGLSIGHASPEAASGGVIGLVEDGDRIEINIPKRCIELMVESNILQKRREAILASGGFKPKRERKVSNSLKLYGHFATSADKGAVRDWSKLS